MNPMLAGDVEAFFALSPMQQGMLFLSLAAPNRDAYIGQMSFVLRGTLDVERFNLAWQTLVRRHAALRTSFLYEGLDQPLQIVHRSLTASMLQQDLSHDLPEERTARLERFLREDRQEPFDLTKPPLFRFHLFRLSRQEHLFVWTRHHIILDGWSVNLLMDELQRLYESQDADANATLTIRRSYRIYIDWLRKKDLEPARVFWKTQFAGFSMPSEIVLDGAVLRGSSPKASMKEEKRILPEEVGRSLGEAARRLAITEGTILCAAWALLLAGHCGNDDVVFGLTLSGRPAELRGADAMIGLFVNTVPARVLIDRNITVAAWLRNLSGHFAAMREHQYLSAAEMRAFASIPADRELFSHILVLESYPASSRKDGTTALGLSVENFQFVDQTNFPLNIGVISEDQKTMLAVYDPDRFDRQFIHELMESYITILDWVGSSGERPVREAQFLSPRQETRLVEEYNATAAKWPPDGTLLEHIEASMLRHRQSIAVRLGGDTLTYDQMDRNSSAIAARLAAMDCRPETIVAVVMERSLELVSALLGILKTGAAYLPLDPEDPPARLASLAQNAGVIITLSRWTSLFAGMGIPIFNADHAALPPDGFRPHPQVHPQQAAYVIYTSGSTGRPKPVVNTLGGLLNRLLWMQSAYPIDESDRVLQKTPYTFDVSVWEFFWPLLYGACLVLAEPGGHRDPAYIRDTIIGERITIAHFIPSMLALFLREERIEACTSLRHVICSGEALSPALVETFYRRCPAFLHNLYGPTEAAIDVTYHHCLRQRSYTQVPIGRPIANTQIFLLDANHRLVPLGAAGEIYIAGTGLGRGYDKQPDRTAERYLPNPFPRLPGERMYRTGDIGRWNEAGEILYLGRYDSQVKLRGVRIEPGEIENTIADYSGVLECVVLAEDLRLAVHIIPARALTADEEARCSAELQRFLQKRLPSSHIPGRIFFHESFPLSANGKIDRQALRARSEGKTGVSARIIDLPTTTIEKQIAEIWQEVLGIERVGTNEKFFDLGGHSLLLHSVSGRLQKTFGVNTPLRVLFNAQTVRAMAEAVLDAQLSAVESQDLISLEEEIRGLPPEEIQRLLLENQ